MLLHAYNESYYPQTIRYFISILERILFSIHYLLYPKAPYHIHYVMLLPLQTLKFAIKLYKSISKKGLIFPPPEKASVSIPLL
jgi:hypothetical protein